MQVSLLAIPGIPMVKPGDDLGALIHEAVQAAGMSFQDDDILVVAQKVVSKAENRLVCLDQVVPSPRAQELAGITGKDAQLIQVILDESNEVLKVRSGLIVVEQRLGFVCANAGVDRSNIQQADGGEVVALLPEDADASARQLRARIEDLTGRHIAVIINDSHGRAFREGTVGVALGVAGLRALQDRRGEPDLFGYRLQITEVGFADEVSAAASMVMGQADEAAPAVIVRGLPYTAGEGSALELARSKEKDMFRYSGPQKG
ncbi:MAG: coenzyme F420-0:L-glutamate ligase [Chloroflexota bacterium]|nr:MAG: coenzyme F420-0:L-glutamate ligase [Chloroflexota bacterium]